MVSFFFFFNDTATTEIYTLSLHDALPIFPGEHRFQDRSPRSTQSIGRYRSQLNVGVLENLLNPIDRKSTRLNSSHGYISYAVFCLKKKNTHATAPFEQLAYSTSIALTYNY